MFKIDGAGATAQKTFTKGDPVQAIPATEVTASWLNAVQGELVKVIEQTGLTLNKADSTQLSKAIAMIASRGDFYTDATPGVAGAYVLTPTFTGFAPTAYKLGMRLRFIPSKTNTGASTVDVNGLGVKNIKTQSGDDPTAAALAAGEEYTLYYDGISFIQKHTVQKKSTKLPDDYQLQTWSDALVNGMYNVSLSAPQAWLPIGAYYIDVQRASQDLSTNQNRTIRAVAYGVGNKPNITYRSTCTNGVWTPFVEQAALPVGSTIYTPGTVPPTGFLAANGALLSRTAYSALYSFAITSGNIADETTWFATRSGSFSWGDLATTFRLPDLRGEFLRGLDDSRGLDAGRIEGSVQLHAIGAHAHTFSQAINLSGRTPSSSYNTFSFSATGVSNTGVTGGTETRPRNVAVLTCIKY